MNIPVLKIRDVNGNFIPINAIRGDRGKSAYEQACEGGYTGTEEEFTQLLNGLTGAMAAEHISDTNNPHKVTAEQTGGVSNTDFNDRVTEFNDKVDRLQVSYDTADIQISRLQDDVDILLNRVTPVTSGGTGATTSEEALANLGGKRIVTGSYSGAGTSGPNVKVQIPLDSLPEFMIIKGASIEFGYFVRQRGASMPNSRLLGCTQSPSPTATSPLSSRREAIYLR